MPTSITVVATSTSAPPAANAAIASCLALRAHLAVHEHDAVVLELAAAQALELGGGGLGLQRLGLLDQRADDERLAAGVELLADALVGAGALVVGAGDEGARSAAARPAARAARSRRGRRRRSARACAGSASRSCAGRAARGPAGALRSSARRWLTPKRCCSSTTATASRSNSTASSIIACVPTSSFSSPVRELAEQVGAAARGRGAGQQRGLHELARHQLLQRREVLLGERLGRRHQRGLGAGLDRAQHRVERDDGLARADLAHQQPLHRALARRCRRRSWPSPCAGRRSA